MGRATTETEEGGISWKKKLLGQSLALYERKNKKDEPYNELKKVKEELFRLGESIHWNGSAPHIAGLDPSELATESAVYNSTQHRM